MTQLLLLNVFAPRKIDFFFELEIGTLVETPCKTAVLLMQFPITHVQQFAETSKTCLCTFLDELYSCNHISLHTHSYTQTRVRIISSLHVRFHTVELSYLPYIGIFNVHCNRYYSTVTQHTGSHFVLLLTPEKQLYRV